MTGGAPATSRVELRSGRVALVAPIHPDDRSRYLSGLEEASPQSLYLRFMAPVTRLGESQLRYLLEIDHLDHEALLAVDEDAGGAVGVARFVRLADAPDTAEAAVLVIDAWQGDGLGTELSRLLAERARAVGVTRFVATLLVSNKAMLGVLERLGPVRTVSRDGPTVEVSLELPPTGVGEPLTGVLREAAAKRAELPERSRA